ASYFGVTKAALQTQLKAGKTLAKIASATSGKSTAGLVAALVSADTARLDAQVKAGKLTKAQEARMLAGLKHRPRPRAGRGRGRVAGTRRRPGARRARTP